MPDKTDIILSPSEKVIAQPLFKYLEPEWTEGKKELIINKPGEIALESFDGTWTYVEDKELGLDALTRILNLMAERTGQKYDVSNPILSCKLPGGHRAQFVCGQQNTEGFSLAVRLKQEREFGIDSFVMSDEDRTQIIEDVKAQKTILISGGTGSGKTTFMNALLKYVPEDERLVTLEDVPELKVPHRNVCKLLFANFSKSATNGDRQTAVNELLNACLRLRPDRILLGEIRKENAFTFCSAINTGHAGSMATIHANDPDAAIDAVINRVLLNGDTSETAINVLRSQLKNDIYAVVQLTRKGAKVHGYYKRLQTNEADFV